MIDASYLNPDMRLVSAMTLRDQPSAEDSDQKMLDFGGSYTVNLCTFYNDVE
jgi:hypothetical protein